MPLWALILDTEVPCPAILAYCKSMPMRCLGCVHFSAPCDTPYIYAHIWITSLLHGQGPSSALHLLNSVGAGDISTLKMRVNRFVFLNLPILSLGDHLGVTVRLNPLFSGTTSPCQLTAGHLRFSSNPLTVGNRHSDNPPFSKHSRHTPPRIIQVEAYCK